jgi:hypothetical protein
MNTHLEIYTSEDILQADDLYEIQDRFCCSNIPFQYQMTLGEIEWYHMVKNRYEIADWITKNTDNEMVLTFDDPFELSEALTNDGMAPKAVMLSDETALQRLFFWLCNED